jgi:hypothetical protein
VVKQAIACQSCTAVVAYVQPGDDGRPKLKFAFGSPLLTVADGEPTAVDRHSQWFVIDIEDELDDTTESTIEVECNCAENGSPRKWSFPLRATLDRLGSRRGLSL